MNTNYRQTRALNTAAKGILALLAACDLASCDSLTNVPAQPTQAIVTSRNYSTGDAGGFFVRLRSEDGRCTTAVNDLDLYLRVKNGDTLPALLRERTDTVYTAGRIPVRIPNYTCRLTVQP